MKTLNVTGPQSPEVVSAAYQQSSEKHLRERLLAIRLAQQGKFTLAEIAQILGRGRATIARWVKAFREGGCDSLLKRKYQGRAPRLSVEIQQQLIAGLKQGRWKTALEIKVWLEENDIYLTRSGVYYWLSQLKASWKVPRKTHVKKKPERSKLSRTSLVLG